MKSKGKRIIGILFSLALTVGMIGAMSQPAYAKLAPVKYLDANGTEQTCEDFTVVTDKTTNFENDNWYVVRDSVEISDRITVNGKAHLILMDGKSLTAGQGIKVENDKELDIYAQSTGEDAGSLTATGTAYDAAIGGGYANSGGTIIINGGNITATAIGTQAAAIGGGQAGSGGSYTGTCRVTINGGNVTANGNGAGAAIGGGSFAPGADVTINDGIVTANNGAAKTYGIGHGQTISSTLSHGNLTLGDGVVMKTSNNNTDWSDYDGINRTRYMKTVAVTKYPVWVGGVQVTSKNMDDVLAKDPENAKKVSFTPAKDGDPAKLTLKGANITTGYYHEDNEEVYGIFYNGLEHLTIESLSGSDNKIIGAETFDSGIRALSTDIKLSGAGKLTVEGYNGIDVQSVDIDGSNVVASGMFGIISDDNIIVRSGNVTVTGERDGIFADYGDVIIKGGKVTATARDYGIESIKNVIIEGGTIEATAAFGITSGEDVIISGGTVNATGTDSDIGTKGMSAMVSYDPAGIWGEETVEITGGKVTAAGDGYGILGTVKNDIAGTGWTDKAGTQGKADIAIKPEGQDISTFKKAQFPAKVDPEPTPTKVSGIQTAKMTVKGTGMTFAWNKIQGAAGYDIYLARCDVKGKHSVLKKVKTIKGNKTFKWTKTGLKKGKSYKAYVKAFVYKNGKKSYVRISPVLHAYSGNVMGKYTNAKSIKVNKTKVVLKKGKTFKVKAKVTKVKKNKKLMPNSHVKTVRYLSTNKKVATVSASGKITAKGKGSCTVIAFAHNGISKSIKVTVK